MTLGSAVFSLLLIGFALVLLVMVLIGFIGSVLGA
jgi:hypothetical protein